MTETRDHGGGVDAAVARWGGDRDGWIDLSTGINPVPYPITGVPAGAWTALPDRAAQDRLIAAARRFWRIPEGLAVVAAPGASALIAAIPGLWPGGRVQISGPTYNEHAAAFRASGWTVTEDAAETRVIVHPNNPDGITTLVPGRCPGLCGPWPRTSEPPAWPKGRRISGDGRRIRSIRVCRVSRRARGKNARRPVPGRERYPSENSRQ